MARPARVLQLLRHPWGVVAMLWFVSCFNFMARLMVTTMHDSVLGTIPMTEAQFGLLSSVFYWTYALCNPLAGYLADRTSRSGVIVASILSWSVVTCLTGFVHSLGLLLVMRGLMAVCESGYMAASLALISEYHRGGTRALATGLHMSGAIFGCALAGLGGWMAEAHSWNFAFISIGLLGTGYGFFLMLALRDAPRSTEEAETAAALPLAGFGEAVTSLFRGQGFRAFLPFAILTGATNPVISSWMPVYLREHFHVSQSKAGMTATGCEYLAGIVGLIIGGAWADRWSAKNVRGYIYVTFVGVLAAVPGIVFAAKTEVLGWAMGGLIVYGLGLEFADATQMPIVCQVVSPRFRATAFGALNFVQQSVAGLAIYWAGSLRDLRFDTGNILVGAGLIQVVAVFTVLRIRPQRRG